MITRCLVPTGSRQAIQLSITTFYGIPRRTYFTNADLMKRDDPYAQLGLTWGATNTEIKEAYKKKARELHPDVNKSDTAEQALRKFQVVHKAYQTLMDVKGAGDEVAEAWSFAVWRNSDIIAQERTDVAGTKVKRPAMPALSIQNKQWGVASIGHPDGGGNQRRRAQFLGEGGPAKGPRTSTVGTGRSKWVKGKEHQPWQPIEIKRAGKGQMNFLFKKD